MKTKIACRVCGCTEIDACSHPEHGRCWWVEFDLCSHCKFWPGESKRFSQILHEQIGDGFISTRNFAGDARSLARLLNGKNGSKHFLTTNNINMEQQKPELKMLPLSSITIGKTNPRKQFDEDAINEIASSIKVKGVIQPVLVRPLGNGLYELVCGERRYRGSIIAKLPEIPCYIRELTDDEALELQITENLQRKDVHPMEEAYAFKQLLEKKSLEEVALQVGKKEFFVKQRVKFNDLLPEWQKLFYKNALSINMALKLAMLPVNFQKNILTDCGIDKDNIDKKQHVNINDYYFRQYSGSLKIAPFSLDDKTLDKKAGDCNSCKFNSAVSNLFPEDEKNPICSNAACYKNKYTVFFDKELKISLADPAIVFITESSYSADRDIEERLKKEGHQVLKLHNDYSFVSIQDAEPDYESYKEDHFDEEDDNEEDFKQQYDEYLKGYQAKKEQCDKKIASGKYLKAFIIDGNSKGQYKYIELKKKSAEKNSKSAIESGTAGAADIDNEIARIKDREKRSKELDGEKVHKLIIEAMKQDKDMQKLPAAFTETDKTLMYFLITEYVSFSSRDKIKKVIGFHLGAWGDKGEKLYQQLLKLTDQQLSFLVRTIVFDKYANNMPSSSGGYMLRKLAENLGTIPIQAYETEQKERADKRQKKVDQRIAELQKQKKELKPVAEKKAAPKKVVKKVIAK